MTVLPLALLCLAFADPPPSFDAAIAALDEADTAVRLDPELGGEALDGALAALTRFPAELAADPEAQELQMLALLNLASVQLTTGDIPAATEAVDEAILVGRGEMPAASFGPELDGLVGERLAALDEAGRGEIVVRCFTPCQVYINEREAEPQSGPLRLGTYRVAIFDPGGVLAPAKHELVLDEDGAYETLDFGRPPAPDLPDRLPVATPTRRPRLLPRWTEIAIAAVGVGVIGGGGGLTARATESTAGPVLLGFGSGMLLTGAVLLIVDEARAERRSKLSAWLRPPLHF